MTDPQPRCATCRWFERWPRDKNYGCCTLIADGPNGRGMTYPNSMANVMSSARVNNPVVGMHLNVRRDFGCILHEPKEADDE